MFHMVPTQPGNQRKPGKKSITFASEGQIREFQKNVSNQGNISICLAHDRKSVHSQICSQMHMVRKGLL